MSIEDRDWYRKSYSGDKKKGQEKNDTSFNLKLILILGIPVVVWLYFFLIN